MGLFKNFTKWAGKTVKKAVKTGVKVATAPAQLAVVGGSTVMNLSSMGHAGFITKPLEKAVFGKQLKVSKVVEKFTKWEQKTVQKPLVHGVMTAVGGSSAIPYADKFLDWQDKNLSGYKDTDDGNKVQGQGVSAGGSYGVYSIVVLLIVLYFTFRGKKWPI